MKPNETLITRWIDGDLAGEELAAMEASAAQDPALAALKEDSFAVRDALIAAQPASIPHADFFTTQVMRKIELEEPSAAVAPAGKASFMDSFRAWLVPAVVAALALSFYMGTQLTSPSAGDSAAATAEVYAPDGRVSAHFVHATSETPAVIVMTGLQAIPDSVEMVQRPSGDASPITALDDAWGAATLTF